MENDLDTWRGDAHGGKDCFTILQTSNEQIREILYSIWDIPSLTNPNLYAREKFNVPLGEVNGQFDVNDRVVRDEVIVQQSETRM